MLISVFFFRYCIYEQCSSQRYQRKLEAGDRPLAIQAVWPGPTPFSFVLRRSPARIEDNNVGNKAGAVAAAQRSSSDILQRGDNSSRGVHHHANRPSWPSEWPVGGDRSGSSTDRSSSSSTASESSSSSRLKGSTKVDIVRSSGRFQARPVNRIEVVQPSANENHPAHRLEVNGRTHAIRLENYRTNIIENQMSKLRVEPVSSNNNTLRLEEEAGSRVPAYQEEEVERWGQGSDWGELDKDSSEEQVSSSEDMDTSLSSNDSPTPPLHSLPLSTSTPLAPTRTKALSTPPSKPSMSFLYPSPDYESFPSKSIPSRPYSSLSTSSLISSTPQVVAPSLPPKPSSLASLFSRPSSSGSSSGFHDYENYFYI